MVWQFGVLLLIFQLLRLLWRAINKPPQFPEEQTQTGRTLPTASVAVAEECRAAVQIIDQILCGQNNLTALDEQLRASEQRLRSAYPGITTEAFEESRRALPLIPPERIHDELTKLKEALQRNVSAVLPRRVPETPPHASAPASPTKSGPSFKGVLVTIVCIAFFGAVVVMLVLAGVLTETPRVSPIPHTVDIDLASFGARQTIKGHFGYASPMGPACPEISNVTDAQLHAMVKQHCSTIIWIDEPGAMGTVYFINWQLPQGIFGSDEIADVLVRRIQQRQGAAFVQHITEEAGNRQTEQRSGNSATEGVSVVRYTDPEFQFGFEYHPQLLAESSQEETDAYVIFRALDGHATLECDRLKETFQSLFTKEMARHPQSWDGDGGSWFTTAGVTADGEPYLTKTITDAGKSVSCDLMYDHEFSGKYEPEFALLKRTLRFGPELSTHIPK